MPHQRIPEQRVLAERGPLRLSIAVKPVIVPALPMGCRCMPLAGRFRTSIALCGISSSGSAIPTCAILGCCGVLAPLMEAIGWHIGHGGGELGCSFLRLSLSLNLHHGSKGLLDTEQLNSCLQATLALRQFGTSIWWAKVIHHSTANASETGNVMLR